MANNPSDSEKLKLQIQIELDQESKRQAQEEINQLQKGTAGTGQKSITSQTKAQTDAIKQQRAELRKLLADERFRIDQIDLSLRKARSAAQGEIQAIRQRAAASKTSIQQTNQLIAQQENIVENANTQAAAGYAQVAMSLDSLMAKYADIPGLQQDIINRQKQLFYATERMNSGFNSMSGSMSQLTGATTSANMAFVNFSRVVQDAPFGLIGLANNIDPLLVSFQELVKAEGGTRQAFAALGRQLMGPAGLIFLLGSALPSALLFLQQRQQKQREETNKAVDNTISYVEELFKLRTNLTLASDGIINQEKALNEYNDSLGKTFGLANNVNEANQILINKTSDYVNAMFLRSQAQVLLNQAASEYLSILSGEAEKMSTVDKVAQTFLSAFGVGGSVLAAATQGLKASQQKDEVEKSVNQKLKDAVKILTESYKLVGDINDARKDEVKTAKELEQIDNRIYKTREEFLIAYYEFINDQVALRLLNEGKLLNDLLKSEFITAEEKKKIFERFENIRYEMHKDFLMKQVDYEIKIEKEKYDLKYKMFNDYLDRFETAQRSFDDRQLAQQDYVLQSFENTNNERAAIELSGQMQLEAMRKEAQARGLADTSAFKLAEASVIKKIDQDLFDFDMQQAELIKDATFAIGEAIFGDTKALRVGEVVVDTIMGIQRALATNIENPVKAAASTAMLIANGAIAIRKITQTKKGDKNIDGGGKRGFYINDVYLDSLTQGRGMTEFNNAKFISMNAQPMPRDLRQAININATVDRRGLAIAVREGERNLRTEQISYI